MAISGKIRRLVFSAKRPVGKDSGWSTVTVPQRLIPFAHSMRLPSTKWAWRALKCSSVDDSFILFSRVNYNMGNYQAWLLLDAPKGISLLARLEDHASHAGLHAHCSCGDELPIIGSQSINVGPDGSQSLYRIPAINSNRQGNCSRRTVQGLTPDDFFTLALMIFRVAMPTKPQGELLV